MSTLNLAQARSGRRFDAHRGTAAFVGLAAHPDRAHWTALLTLVMGAELAAQFSSTGTLLAAAIDPTIAIQDIVFGVGALMFSAVLYRWRYLPRWLSGWGILGAAAYLTAGVIAVFSTHLVVLLLPLALQEMVMAVWLIVRGFDPVALATDEHQQPMSV
jgi:hypothetical protein